LRDYIKGYSAADATGTLESLLPWERREILSSPLPQEPLKFLAVVSRFDAASEQVYP
jgi:hypothetical protein